MRLGLLTDIHEATDFLRQALIELQSLAIDQVIVIGDIVEMGQRIDETCRLLQDANSMGVWGNHDYGLCVDPDPETREKYAPVVFDYARTLKPRLEIGGCYFCHVEPWLNPEELADLWYFHGPPDEPWKRRRIFDAAPARVMFMGHYHRWLVVTPETLVDWDGRKPIDLSQGQFLVVIDALLNGSYAVYDTDSSILTPYHVSRADG